MKTEFRIGDEGNKIVLTPENDTEKSLLTIVFEKNGNARIEAEGTTGAVAISREEDIPVKTTPRYIGDDQ